MIGQNYIQDFSLKLIPRYRRSPSGFLSFNCVACVFKGEPTPDNKHRMGLKIEANGGVRFNCFRCHTTGSWVPGQMLSKNIKQILEWLGASKQDIEKVNFECLKIKQQDVKNLEPVEQKTFTNEINLPSNAQPMELWAKKTTPPDKFVSTVKYIFNRNEKLLDWFTDWYWSSDMPDHAIIPLRYQGFIYGWVARLARKQKTSSEPRYLTNNNQGKFLFNAGLLDDHFSKYVILCEGPLDGIALNAISLMGNEITKDQLKWLQNINKQIIVFPDRDAAGQMLIDQALKNGWFVSMPEIFKDTKCKDGLDFVNLFGRLFTVKNIIDSATDSTLKINITRKNWSLTT